MSVLFTKHSAVGHKLTEQGKSDGFDGCDRPSNLAPLHWRHNDHDGVSNHQSHGCLLNRLFRRRSKKTPKLRVTGLCVGNSPGPVNSQHKGPVTRNMFPFDDVIMQIGFKSSINQATWLLKFDEWPKTNNKAPLRWHQALCIISNPSVNWKWSHSPETLNSGKNWRFFLSHVTLKLDGWPWKTIGHLFYITFLSFVQHFKATGIFKLELQSGNAEFGPKLAIFCPRYLENWRMTLKNNRAPFLYCVKLSASF